MSPECLSDEEIQRFVAGSPGSALADRVHEHIAICDACLAVVSALARDLPPARPGSAGSSIGSDDTHDVRLLETAPALTSTPAVPSRLDALDRAGTRIGRFFLLELLGSGGMGVVYAAFDPDLDRKIAIKLLRPRHRPSASDPDGARRTARTRMLREARALARVSHRNVVSVFEVGPIGDEVFIAMEFLDKGTLRQWLDRERPSQPEIVERFLHAGRGLAAVHAAGLAHRDFKPDNVLIGRDGHARVADFGLARHETGRHAAGQAGTEAAGDDTLQGAVVGTPAYMAPEQRAGQLADARSDQYSFCLSLAEALAGLRPGQRPDDLLGLVPARMRSIVARGMAEDPADRHASMDALLAALERRAGGRRGRWALFSIPVLTAVAWWIRPTDDSCATEASTGFELQDRWSEDRRASIERVLEGPGVDAPALSERLDAYAERWIAARSRACEVERSAPESEVPFVARRRRCLDDRRLAFMATLDVFEDADDTVRARADDSVASLPPVESCDEARYLAADVAPAPDAVQAEVEEIRAAVARAQALLATDQIDAAAAASSEATARAREVGYTPVLVVALNAQVDVRVQAGDVEKALQLADEAYTLSDRASRQAAAANLVGRSEVAKLRGSPSDAIREATRAIELLAEALGPDNVELATPWRQLGSARRAARDWPGAREAFEHGYEIVRRDPSIDPSVVIAHLSGLGAALYDADDYEGAQQTFEEALDLAVQSGRTSILATLETNLGSVALERGRHDEAVAHQRRALDHAVDAWGARHHMVASVHLNLGRAQAYAGDNDAALRHYRLALALWQETLGPEHPNLITAHHNLATALRFADDAPGCVRHAEEELRLTTLVYGADTVEVAEALASKSRCLEAARRYEDALLDARRAVALAVERLGTDHRKIARLRVDVALALSGTGRHAEAIEEARRACEILAATAGWEDPDTLSTHAVLARLLVDAGRGDEARAVIEEAASRGSMTPELESVRAVL